MGCYKSESFQFEVIHEKAYFCKTVYPDVGKCFQNVFPDKSSTSGCR